MNSSSVCFCFLYMWLSEVLSVTHGIHCVPVGKQEPDNISLFSETSLNFLVLFKEPGKIKLSACLPCSPLVPFSGGCVSSTLTLPSFTHEARGHPGAFAFIALGSQSILCMSILFTSNFHVSAGWLPPLSGFPGPHGTMEE